MSDTLHYVHDPMCSWCWGFAPTFTELVAQAPAELRINRVLGGLAPDSDEPMPQNMRDMLQANWQRIEATIPGTEFNYAFWTDNTPRRSTWPSCRAVIAARLQSPDFEVPMIHAIQTAYYLHAKNPSDTSVLVHCATDIGCDAQRFEQELQSEAIHNLFLDEVRLTQQLGVQGFPSLVLENANGATFPVAVDYNNSTAILDRIDQQRAA